MLQHVEVVLKEYISTAKITSQIILWEYLFNTRFLFNKKTRIFEFLLYEITYFLSN